MPLPITSDVGEPVQRAAVTEKTFDQLWVRNLVIVAPSPTSEGQISLEWLPMAEDGELYTTDGPRRIETAELFRAISEVPELAAAYDAVLAAIAPTARWIAEQQSGGE